MKDETVEKLISKSTDGKTRQVVRITKHKGYKNRKGDVYKTSRTLHLKAK
jgi:hypothetical protein|tara:strand:+ start:1074 stop:1223 length:150 start_codon:yes stop_codon:yes gene_type:complete